MPTTNWNTTTIDGQQYLVIDTASFRVPLDWDPSSNMFIAVAAPTGGLGSFPALVQGDPGTTPTIDPTITFTALDYSDATADSAAWTEIAPDTYRLSLALHKGAPGASGTTTLHTASDVSGTPTSGQILVVNSTADGFVYAAQKAGDRYVPASIASTPSGNAVYTLCSVSVPAQPFPWRPIVSGQCVVTGTGSNVTVDLVARLADAAAGNVVGRAIDAGEMDATSHIHPTLRLAAGPPAASIDSYDKVAAGSAAVIYLRAERQTGSDTFTTAGTTTTFCVRVAPTP